jgi:hypothetical protein
MDKENQPINQTTEPIETDETKSFAELLAESEIGTDRLKPGQRVDVVIVKITPERRPSRPPGTQRRRGQRHRQRGGPDSSLLPVFPQQ